MPPVTLAAYLRTRSRGWTRACRLLDRDGRADSLEGGLRLLGHLLDDLAVEHGLRRAVDEILGLLEAEAGDLSENLDDLDLLVTACLEDDVELVLRRGRGGSGN